MNIQFEIEDDYPVRNWKLTESAWFRRTKDPLGDLSNFAVGMPIRIQGFEVQSSEHLYQAMRFPHLPDVQLQILDADTPIVEFSTRDSFWGAGPEWDGSETLVGRNVLGCLLTELRTEFHKDRWLGCSARPAFPRALLCSRPI